MRIQRSDDMHPPGVAMLRLTLQPDGDVIVAVEGIDPTTDKPAYATAEFCTPGRGGGRSPRTHAALRALAAAMQEDAAGS